ncbi:RNA polymerase sigma factor [Planktosalinus lacus]|uniref:DNA-directed RNA polymerase sigma-70 factor n=1 Tax=Planktosalinus lacus TaxID=1526573 RepID=A0A8J2VDP2_9FLAO|nr:RNA polymerase sigma-70 factor [Planktosalinus lacus]GGD98792.1 DNA-directed RNA polymerase sigma-70 factor [Planktosalinus lacus]
MSDQETVCKESVYNKLFQSLSPAIYNFIYFKCGDVARAEDLVQEAFIKLWENCSKVPQNKAKSFLYTVCNNAFLNEVAHQKVVLNFTKKSVPKINDQSPQFVLEEKEFEAKLEKALANLTEAQRTAFLLNRIEGKKYREIAEILDISVKAVEKRMSQALDSLRTELKNMNI